MTYARVMLEAYHCQNIYYFLFYVLYRNEVGVNVAEIKIWCIVIDVLQLVLYNVCGTAIILEVSFEL